MMITAKIQDFDGVNLVIAPSSPVERDMLQKQSDKIEIRIVDGRTISAEQRRKIFAVIRDISDWSGHDPEYLRQYLTWDFRSIDGLEPFSLSDTDMTTARDFITYLISFCMRHDVPTRDTLFKYQDDLYKYLYLCLEHRKCAVCNKRGEVHHVDRVGMGRGREAMIHIGMKAVCLCREHHENAHRDETGFFERFHLFGIPLDAYLCKRLGLKAS